jgi:hypothetical protein
MKRASLILAVAVLCLGVPALMLGQANPNIGTWKLNLEKSKFTGVPAPKSLTRTVTADGDSAKYSFEGTGADGTALAYGFTAKYDGKDYAVSGNGAPSGADHISFKRVNSHSFVGTLKKDGKVVVTSQIVVSHDGKMTTVSSKGTGSDGKPMHTVQVYDKQ